MTSWCGLTGSTPTIWRNFEPGKVRSSVLSSVRRDGVNSKTFLQRLTFCLAILFLVATAVSAKPRSFHQLVNAYFDDYFKANPSQATVTGFHQYDTQLEDFSLAAHQRNRRRLL